MFLWSLGTTIPRLFLLFRTKSTVLTMCYLLLNRNKFFIFIKRKPIANYMSKDRKKKLANQQAKQQLKENINKQKREYYAKLFTTAQKLGIEKAVRKLVTDEERFFFRTRLVGFRFKNKDKKPLPIPAQKQMQKNIYNFIGEHTLYDYPNGQKVSLLEILETLYFLGLYLLAKTNDEFELPEKYQDFKEFFDFWQDNYGQWRDHLEIILYFISATLSSPVHGYWVFKLTDFFGCPSYPIQLGKPMVTYIDLEYQSNKGEKYKLRSKGDTRTLYRLYHYSFQSELTPCLLPPKLFNQPKETQIPVLLLSHAERRINERLDALWERVRYQIVAESIQNATKLVQYNKNTLLIPIYYKKIKVGYVVCFNHKNQHLIIKTFLFITCKGTPEGDKLARFTGLSKEDEIYLNIDRMSTFVHNQLSDNEELYAIFEQVGLSHLDNLKNKITRSDHFNTSSNTNLSKLKEMLRKKQEEEQLSQTELDELMATSTLIKEEETESLPTLNTTLA